jgi:hypothetical protein
MPSNKVKRREAFRNIRSVKAYFSAVPYNVSESTEKYLLKVFFIRGI